MLGGLIGGAAFDPLMHYTLRPELSKLIALCAIGLVAGLATGLIENAAKSGWVRVISGLIAGKQFILYRNPTFIGSGPDCRFTCSRTTRWAADMPQSTLCKADSNWKISRSALRRIVNGKPTKRARLRHGDRISIGATTFLFQEKKPTVATA